MTPAPKQHIGSKPNEKPKAEDKREGAPKTETPETKVEPPAGAPRDDAAPLETPEAPVIVGNQFVTPPPAPTIDEEAIVELKKDELKEEAAAHDLPVSGTKAELTERLLEVAEEEKEALQEYEDLHIASHPVDSHAPVWTPRKPNTTGGYS